VTYSEIEELLGVSTVRQLEVAATHAYTVALKDSEGQQGAEALEELLLGLLASVVIRPGNPHSPQDEAKRCGERLLVIVAKTQRR